MFDMAKLSRHDRLAVSMFAETLAEHPKVTSVEVKFGPDDDIAVFVDGERKTVVFAGADLT